MRVSYRRVMHLDPTTEQAEAFAGTEGATEPVYMLNLLRFKKHAEGIDEGVSGMEAYGRYAAGIGPLMARVGGEVVWAGKCDSALIGPEAPEWDVVAIARYPSRAAFLAMVGDPEYLEYAEHRSAGLADSRLIPCEAAAA
jgi:uncharacterized protein (DUF1330 family)